MKARIIKAHKVQRISQKEMHYADIVIVNGTVIKDRNGLAPRPATTRELKAAVQK